MSTRGVKNVRFVLTYSLTGEIMGQSERIKNDNKNNKKEPA